MYPSVHSSTIYNSQGIEVTQVSVNRWMNKEVVNIYNGILVIKKWNSAVCSNMDGPGKYYA